ncbi:hypothetical protein COCMIDRAFT_109094, partial [Bipolaris oryzae ATCC 44560]
LEEVRGMRRHAESNNLVLCTELVKLWRSVATMAVENKKPIDSSCTSRCMLVKYHEWWQRPARRVNALDRCNPLTIAWLYDDCPTNSIRASHDF